MEKEKQLLELKRLYTKNMILIKQHEEAIKMWHSHIKTQNHSNFYLKLKALPYHRKIIEELRESNEELKKEINFVSDIC